MIEYQRLILADCMRNEAFHEALRRVIRPGESVVADIGSGTGFLGFLALRLGARECYLCEVSGLLPLSRKIARLNGMQHCHFLQKHSTLVSHPPRADIVTCEMLGNFALEENILETLRDARRFLKPGGILIPGALTQYVAPVVTEDIHRELSTWDGIGYGLDFTPAALVSRNNVYVRPIRQRDLLDQEGAVQTWDRLDFLENPSSIREARVVWNLRAPAQIHGFAAFWEAELVPGVALSTSPSAPATHWQQVFLPILRPIEARKGERIVLHLRSDSRIEVKIRIRWTVERVNAKGERVESMDMDMKKGHLE